MSKQNKKGRLTEGEVIPETPPRKKTLVDEVDDVEYEEIKEKERKRKRTHDDLNESINSFFYDCCKDLDSYYLHKQSVMAGLIAEHFRNLSDVLAENALTMKAIVATIHD
jgi:hypothetical protein